jgi:hypothetical protein
MIGVALAQPLIHASGKVPIEWILLGLWAVLGVGMSTITVRARRRMLSR